LIEWISLAVAQINAWLRVLMINLGRSIPGLLTSVFIVLVIIYVLLPRYRGIGKNEILDIVPFPPEITQLFLDKIDLMIKAMFKGTFVIAITQGLAMGLILWLAGVPYTIIGPCQP
jgi:predicted PurR-regulated permease PerM